MLCSYMPSSVADQCENFVATYGDQIIKLIIEAEMNPEAVCSALMLCTQTNLWGKHFRQKNKAVTLNKQMFKS